MPRTIISVLVGISVLCTVAAQAQECRIVAVKNAKAGLVAHPGKLSEMLGLLRTPNVDDKTEAAICCLACMPRVGTKVLITERASTFYTVRVLEGPHRGCTGEIVIE
ncbi:MAG: hypothetical protein ACREQ3_05675, partial [Candidatus Binatia bacterium]